MNLSPASYHPRRALSRRRGRLARGEYLDEDAPMLSIERVRERRHQRDFLSVPERLHADDPIYTPPLRIDLLRSLSDRNPLWQQGRGERDLFVAYRGGRPVGRIVAHVHHESNRRHGERAGFFGYLECPDDREVAEALLGTAADRHRRAGLETLRGPYELTISQCVGAVVSGFDEPASFSQSWNAPHIPRLLEGLGFEVALRLATFRLDDAEGLDPEALLGPKHRAWLADPRVRVRSFEMARFEQDLAAAMGLLNEAFGGNFGFVPLAPDEVAFLAAPMKRVVRPDLTVFVEVDGRPAGVGMLLPDFHVLFRRMAGRVWPLGWAQFLLGSRALDAAVVQFIATTPALQNQGLMRVLVAEAVRRLRRAGFRTLDGTWISDSNAASRAQAQALGMREKHRLALFSRAL
jgi:GNAT superfamily N-acetyltransferase